MYELKDDILCKDGQPFEGFFYDESIAGHNYYFKGKPMTGTTSISKLAKDYEPLMKWQHSQGKEGKEFGKTMKEAGNLGKIAHQHIETCLKTGERTVHENEQVQLMVQNFFNWLDGEEAVVVASELKTFNAETFIGGTIDEILIIRNEQFIGDTKTSSGIYSDFFCQMGAYLTNIEWMLEHRKDEIPLFVDGVEYKNIDEYLNKLAPRLEKPVGCVIINIKKDGTFEKEEDVRWSLDPERDMAFFANTLGMYRIRSSYGLN